MSALRLFPYADRLGDSLAEGHAVVVNSGIQRLVLDPIDFCPVLKGSRNTVVCDISGNASIHDLLVRRGPSAVFWAVVAIVINAVNRVLPAGLLSHVGKKIIEALPPFTHGYTPAAVCRVFPVFYVFAPRPHLVPYVVGWGLGHAMTGEAGCVGIGKGAPAANAVPSAQVCGVADSPAATGASAVPSRPTISLADGGNCSKTPVLMAGDVQRIAAKLNRCKMEISHCLVSFKALVRGLPVGAGSSRYSTTPHPINAQITGAST